MVLPSWVRPPPPQQEQPAAPVAAREPAPYNAAARIQDWCETSANPRQVPLGERPRLVARIHELQADVKYWRARAVAAEKRLKEGGGVSLG
jgi:transglutaminase-like putative cysteine protease